jgi:flagellin-specific chaperone FliS
LVVLLYEGLIRFGNEARDAIVAAETNPAAVSIFAARIQRCIEILTALNTALRPDVDPGLCMRLSDLYTFFADAFSRASQNRDPKEIDGILPLIQGLCDTWEKVDIEGGSPQDIPSSPFA